MKPLDFALLSDENIAPDVVAGLRARGCDLRTAGDERLIGRPDVEVLERATNQGRVVVTHDLAFGRSAIRNGTPFVGIIYLPAPRSWRDSRTGPAGVPISRCSLALR